MSHRTVGTFNPPKIHLCSPYLLFPVPKPPSAPLKTSKPDPPQCLQTTLAALATPSFLMVWAAAVQSFLPVPKSPPALSKPLQTRSLQTLRCAFQAVSSAWAKALSYGFETAVCPLQTLRCALQAVSSARPGPKLCFTVWILPSAPSNPCAAPPGCLISKGQRRALWFRDSHLPPPNPALRLPGCLISQGQSSVLRFETAVCPLNPLLRL